MFDEDTKDSCDEEDNNDSISGVQKHHSIKIYENILDVLYAASYVVLYLNHISFGKSYFLDHNTDTFQS